MGSSLLAACCLLSGHVCASSGKAVSGAEIVVIENGVTRSTRTNAAGNFAIRVTPGHVVIVTTAQGFKNVDVGPIDVRQDERIDVALGAVDAPTLRAIATVSVNGSQTGVHEFIPNVVLDRASLDQLGAQRIIEGLAQVPSVTFARPDGGASTTPVPVALRGPDPSETLVALDGQILNDANTGDLDLSQLPLAALSDIEVTEGLGPMDSEGSNTIGGEVNFVSLRPTLVPHAAFSLAAGSFGRSEGWVNATGTAGNLGYAFAVDDTQEHGYVDQGVTRCSGGFNPTLPPGLQCVAPEDTHLGSSISAHTVLTNLVYNFSQRADIGLRIF